MQLISSYHLSHAGLEPFSIQFGSACLVHIFISQSHKPTGNTENTEHEIWRCSTLYGNKKQFYIILYNVFRYSVIIHISSEQLIITKTQLKL